MVPAQNKTGLIKNHAGFELIKNSAVSSHQLENGNAVTRYYLWEVP